MQIIAGVIIGLLLIALGPLLLIFSLGWFRTDAVADRVQEYSDTRESRQRQMTEEIFLSRIGVTGSFVQRTITPFIRRSAKFLGRLTPAQAIADQEHKLILAGQPLGLGAREFYGLRLIFIVLGFALAYLLLRQGFDTLNLVGALLIFILFLMLPVVWIRRLIRNRQKTIIKGFPDALDMLSVCASAGLGFDQSMDRVSEFWQTQVGNEFGRVISEMEMGLSRSESLRNLAYRTEVPELSSFVSLIIQAEKLGMSISNTINAMAEQMRIERRFRAQEEARKLPNKILFPLVFFIFPAMIAVILGPSIPQLINLFDLVNAG
jgi:tight adherence protein C